uniref:SH3 domain-containing protein n=1 Tax=Eptatretus burgeri TaxID=7764 RepID=A0A8C4WXI4_EPTBU
MAVLSGQTCVALYPYVGEPGQKALTFAPGDAIRVRSTTREGWWEGEKEGQRGWFPASYVQLLEVRPSLTPRAPHTEEEEDSKLPPGWQSVPSPSGQIYYVNTQTNGEEDMRCTSCAAINDVTFPSAEGTAEQSLLKPDEWSYCDHFWVSLSPLGSNTIHCIDLFLGCIVISITRLSCFLRFFILISNLLRKWILYGRLQDVIVSYSPLMLANRTLAEAWAQIKKGLSAETEVHLKFNAMKKNDSYVVNMQARKGLVKRQRELEMREKQSELKPSNKAEVDIMKARMRSTQAGDDLMKCVDLYNQAQFRWFEEMVTSSLELERLEADRVDKVQQQMFCYAQLRRETDMFNQSTLEPIDQALQKVEPGRDRELWVRERKTGHLRPVDMDL